MMPRNQGRGAARNPPPPVQQAAAQPVQPAQPNPAANPDGIRDVVLKSRDPQIGDSCLVCHAEFVETQRISVIDHANGVHHQYHYLCLRGWRTTRNGNSDTCPYDRIAITPFEDLLEPLHKDATSPQNKLNNLGNAAAIVRQMKQDMRARLAQRRRQRAARPQAQMVNGTLIPHNNVVQGTNQQGTRRGRRSIGARRRLLNQLLDAMDPTNNPQPLQHQQNNPLIGQFPNNLMQNQPINPFIRQLPNNFTNLQNQMPTMFMQALPTQANHFQGINDVQSPFQGSKFFINAPNATFNMF